MPCVSLEFAMHSYDLLNDLLYTKSPQCHLIVMATLTFKVWDDYFSLWLQLLQLWDPEASPLNSERVECCSSEGMCNLQAVPPQKAGFLHTGSKSHVQATGNDCNGIRGHYGYV